MALTESDIKIIIAAELKKAGFDKAAKATTSLENNFKKLGRTIGVVFSVAAVTKFGRAAVTAFKQDEIAATRFEKALQNVNLGFASPEIEKYLEALERSTFVTKGELRPAFQTLAQTTQSVAMSQDLLATALDVSAGTGYDLSTVINDLSRAYLGNNNGLAKYNLGLTKAELRTTSFVDIQKILNDQFTGQKAAQLETYSGKVAAVSVAYERLQTTVGEGLVDAFGMLAGEGGINGASQAMDEFGIITANVLRGVGYYVGQVTSQIGGRGGLMEAIRGTAMTGNPLAALIVALEKAGQKTRPLMFPTAGIGQPAVDAQLKAIEEEALKRQKEIERLRLKAAREAAKREQEARKRELAQQALKKAGAVFDLQRIQIEAALKNKITEEEKLRLNLMKALLDENEVKATKLAEQLKKSQEDTKVLSESLSKFVASDPFAFWATYFATQKKERDDLDTDLKEFDANDPFSFWGTYWAMQKKERDTLDKDIKAIEGQDPFKVYPDAFKAQKDAADALDKNLKGLKAGDPFPGWDEYIAARIAGVQALKAELASLATAQSAADKIKTDTGDATVLITDGTQTTVIGEEVPQPDLSMLGNTLPGLENYSLGDFDIFGQLKGLGGVNLSVNVEGSIISQEDFSNALLAELYKLQDQGVPLVTTSTTIGN